MFDRRSMLAGGTAMLATAACSRSAPAVVGDGRNPLPIPPLLDTRVDRSFALRVQSGTTSFHPGRPSTTLGYNGSYLGPTILVRRGDDVAATVTNGLAEDTTVHWHGLLIPGELDGGPHQIIAPGATWRPTLPIRQPAATLLYHSHVHGLTARQVYSGLAGALLVTDEEEEGLGLPSEYGTDDLPLIIQDRQLENGRLIVPAGMMVEMLGRRGNAIVVNGAVNPVATVPDRLVRLRLVNGSNARIYDLSFSDRRGFHWIGTEGGLLEKPVALQSMTLAPGQRVELLVNFTDGKGAALVTGADPNSTMMGGMGMMGGRAGATDADAPTTVLRFEPQPMGQARASDLVPALLASRARADPVMAVRRRSLVLNMAMGGVMGARGGGRLTINGKPFEMKRIDETVKLGSTEIWTVSGEMMQHPFHIHGVHFEVLSRGGKKPGLLDQGPRDTVLVKEPVELLIRFDQPAMKAPFMYHCHILEHEDNGMMGQFSVV